MVLKQMDALEFVNSLEGGWDTIFWDPPYITEGSKKNYRKEKVTKRNKWLMEKIHRFSPEASGVTNNYSDIKELIKEKMVKDSAIIIEKNKVVKDYWDKHIILCENKKFPFPQKININHSYIGFNFVGEKLQEIPKGLLYYVEVWDAPNYGNNQFRTKAPAMSISPKFIEKLLVWSNASYVLDPFGGSFVTAKVCKKLGIRIDSCDKYLKPPDIIGLEKWID